MTSDQPVPQSPSPPNVAALVEAIDARSRQAGADGATEVMQRMLASVTDALAAIQDRLDRVEESLAGPDDGAVGLAEAVQAGLASFNARLGRLEEAFVQAVDDSGSGTQAVVDEVRVAVSRALEEAGGDGLPAVEAVGVGLASLGERLAAVERRVTETPGSLNATVDSAVQSLQLRIDSLEQSLRTPKPEPADPTAAVRAAVAPVLERIGELDASVLATATSSSEGVARVEAVLGALPARLASLEERLVTSMSGALEGASAVDQTVLARLEEAVDRLDRDEASARLVSLVEERMSVGLRAVTERTDEVRRAVAQLGAATASDDGALDDLVSSVRALQAATRGVPDEVASTIASQLTPLDDVVSRLAALTTAVQELGSHVAASMGDRTGSEEVVEGLGGVIRRESELLTQRVAALAVGVEATRVLLEQQLHAAENSLGHKAGEVTRRLAADFGIKTRRNGSGGRRDPRELGSG